MFVLNIITQSMQRPWWVSILSAHYPNLAYYDDNLLESDVWICLGSKRKLGQFEAGSLLRCLSLQRLTDGSYTSHFFGH